MGGKHDDVGVDALSKLVRQQVSDLKIKNELKDLLLFVLDNPSAFIAFARAYAQQQATGSVDPAALMTDFLKSKGRSLAEFGVSLSDSETLADAWAAMSLVMNINDSLKYSSGGPVGLALTEGFLINDAADFLANFTPAQRAYYELFLRKSSVMIGLPAINPARNNPAASGPTIRCY